MIPIYDENKEHAFILHKVSHHAAPHIHETIELIYVTNGTLVLGVNEELYLMEKGDFAIVFPNMIHHYQVFSEGKNSACYIYPPIVMLEQQGEDLQKYYPDPPVIKKEMLHEDVVYAIKSLQREKFRNPAVDQAYIQIILARIFTQLRLKERKDSICEDLIYQTVSYIAGHFKEELSLGSLAKNLGVNKFVLSRIFSSTFHKNFNQYVNEHRLNYVCSRLEYSSDSITAICLEAGFQSQRTFNRVFQDTYHMTPRAYRNKYKERYLIKE